MATPLRPAPPAHPAPLVRAPRVPDPAQLRSVGGSRRRGPLPRVVRRAPPPRAAPRRGGRRGSNATSAPTRPTPASPPRPAGSSASTTAARSRRTTSSSPRATTTPPSRPTGPAWTPSRARSCSPATTATVAPSPGATCSSSAAATPAWRSPPTSPTTARPGSGSRCAPRRTSCRAPGWAGRRREPASSCGGCRRGWSTGSPRCSRSCRSPTSPATACPSPAPTCTRGCSSAGSRCRTSASSTRSAPDGSSRWRRCRPSRAPTWCSPTARACEPSAVVVATGYRAGLEPLVGHLGVLDGRGLPLVHGAARARRRRGPVVHGLHQPHLGDAARAADRRGADRGGGQPGRRSVSSVKRCARSRSTSGAPRAVAGVSTPAASGRRSPSSTRLSAAWPSMYAVPR